MQIQLIITLLIALVLIVLTVQNPNPVPVQFMAWSSAKGLPLIVLVLISSLAGVITSALMGLRKQLKLQQQIRDLKREVDDLCHPAMHNEDDDIGQ